MTFIRRTKAARELVTACLNSPFFGLYDPVIQTWSYAAIQFMRPVSRVNHAELSPWNTNYFIAMGILSPLD